MANVREYDVEKLNKVKEEITYDYLKTLQLQCEAQLRLIRLLESDFEDSKYIIC